MSEEDIKKIAYQYAEQYTPLCKDEILRKDAIRLNAEKGFVPFLEWLSKDYCIVPKDKVREYYDLQESISHMGNHVSGKTLAQGAVMGLLKIFGKELFEQKGE